MHHRVILPALFLGIALSVDAEEYTAPVTVEGAQPGPSAVIQADEPIDSQVIERMRLPGAADASSAAILVDPRAETLADQPVNGEAQAVELAPDTNAVTVDVAAVHDRVGNVADIRVLNEDGTVTASLRERETITLEHGAVLAVRREQAMLPAVQPEFGVSMPSSTILYTMDASGRTRELSLVHRSVGLYWQAERAHFAGDLLVGIVDLENPHDSGSLGATTIPVQLLAPPGTLNRTDLALSTFGVPFERVTVETEAPRDPFVIDLVSQIDPDLPRAELQVHRPRIALSVPNSLQGLGVQENEVSVSGIDSPLPAGETITLDLDNGWLATRTVVVDTTGTASTRVRSTWLGKGTLSVVAPSTYQAEPRTIRYTLPLRFIIATLAGGMLGALVLVHMLKRKGTGSTWSYWLDWVVGLIIGAGATTMAYAGMKLPEWIPVPPNLVGEVTPFALSFICAAAGTTVIHSVVNGQAMQRSRSE